MTRVGAVDPGRSKCGLVLVDVNQSLVVEGGVRLASDVEALLSSWCTDSAGRADVPSCGWTVALGESATRAVACARTIMRVVILAGLLALVAHARLGARARFGMVHGAPAAVRGSDRAAARVGRDRAPLRPAGGRVVARPTLCLSFASGQLL